MYSLQANQSTTAARIAIAPTHKGLNLFIDLFLNIVFQMTILSIVFFYMYTILQVDFGNQLGFVAVSYTHLFWLYIAECQYQDKLL